MATSIVTFIFLTGINKKVFKNVLLKGNWDANGLYNDQWTASPMTEFMGTDGCPAFSADVNLDLSGAGRTFSWGVQGDAAGGPGFWLINTEVNDPNSCLQNATFQYTGDPNGQTTVFYFTYKRRLGANQYFPRPDADAQLQFSVWAPNAQTVEAVFGPPNGYIYDNGAGIDAAMPVVPLSMGEDGIWTSSPIDGFKERFEGKYYMYRITNKQGQITYKSDIFSRGLVGRGAVDPNSGTAWDGTIGNLDGMVSCSIITDPDTISAEFPLPTDRPPVLQEAEDFWESEFTAGKPVPTDLNDLVIYELHVGALGNIPDVGGTLADAVNLLPQLVELGINAIELLPMAEFSGTVSWGYGDSHHLVIQSSAGGRDEYRYFIRECHRNGIAVIQDVCYNHYEFAEDRVEPYYDSTDDGDSIYLYYVGQPSDYPTPDNGFVNNGSAGRAPNYKATVVRQQFISGSVFLVDEMHVDGLRVDLTDAIHQNNALALPAGYPYAPVPEANEYGCKFLREWGRTLRTLYPNLMLMAEDYTGWSAMLESPAQGGMGFNAIWSSDLFHSLIGYQSPPMLLANAGYGDNGPLDMATFSCTLFQTQYNKVVYHSNHDNAGNCLDNQNGICYLSSHRTMVTAVNEAPIIGETRTYAESRSRVVASLSIFSAGTPLFFMGEEIAAIKPYTYDDFINNREDLAGDRYGVGAKMFKYYQDVLEFNQQHPSIRSNNIYTLLADNTNRILVFKRWSGVEQVLIVASLNNNAFASYTINSDAYSLPDGGWKESLNSDATIYGGSGTGNYGAVIPANNGAITMTIPANGVLAFVKVS
jgi:1,4-alpha-glucan branching enzyme